MKEIDIKNFKLTDYIVLLYVFLENRRAIWSLYILNISRPFNPNLGFNKHLLSWSSPLKNHIK